ncbi:capsid protein [Sewage-associated circular DNA virus-19]|uniref:Capsid protein n=1 Tax=Sewage-associated circular DNA virus-19 TaxID=1592086 RepID=A0A0B4UI41_9VIRU|nr:capsid protein [Sewage-associated circular DNA virus-19]AJD07530.1 capsid protein [Sewage-associated circular DNA virus-19]
MSVVRKRTGGYTTYAPNKKMRSGRDILVSAGLAASRKYGPRLVSMAAQKLASMAYAAAKDDPITQFRNAKKRTKGRSYSEQKGVAAGKFRATKRSPKNIWLKYTRKGCVTTKEHGCVLTGTVNTNAIYFGHSTHANTYLMLTVYMRAIVIHIFRKGGVQIEDIETESPGSGGSMTIEYTYNTDIANQFVTVAFTGGLTLNQIAGSFASQFTNILFNNANDEQRFFPILEAKIEIPNLELCKQDYRNSIVHVMVKSDLKVQNRTLATGTDEDNNSSENIANQPLYGKFYHGKGNGVFARANAGAGTGKSITAGCSSGLIAYAPPAGALWLREPPLPQLFTPMPKHNKALLNPGEVKTNSLLATYRVRNLDFFKSLFFGASTSLAKDVHVQHKFGKYCFFALEKMLTVSAADSSPQVGLELNQRVGVMFTFPRNTDTAEITEVPSFITPLTT